MKDPVRQPIEASGGGAVPRIACVTNASFSGFTIFCLLADAHPEISALGDGLNPRILAARGESFVCSCGDLLKDCPFWSDVFSGVAEQGISFSLADCNLRYSFLNTFLDRALGRYHDDPIRRGIRRLALAHSARYQRHVALHTARNVAFSRSVLACSGASVLLHNTKPLLMLHYLRDCPDLNVKVIRMVRDARGFVNSVMKRGSTARDAAHRWLKYHQRVAELTRGLGSDRVFTLKYEELCGNTEGCMRAVFRFLGVSDRPVSRKIIPAEHHIAGNDLRLKEELTVRLDEDWQAILSRSELRTIEKVCGPMHRELGYLW